MTGMRIFTVLTPLIRQTGIEKNNIRSSVGSSIIHHPQFVAVGFEIQIARLTYLIGVVADGSQRHRIADIIIQVIGLCVCDVTT